MNNLVFIFLLLFSILYIYSSELKKNNKIVAITIFLFSLYFYKNKKLDWFFILFGASILLFFYPKSRNIKELYTTYEDDNISDLSTRNEYLCKIYGGGSHSSQGDGSCESDLNKANELYIQNDSRYQGIYQNSSEKIISDDNKLDDNLSEQARKYDQEDKIMNELYDKEYDIYNHEHNKEGDEKYREIGAFKDDPSSRAFRYGPQTYGYNADSCQNACKNYRYFSLQDNGQCFCENDWNHATKYGRDSCGKMGASRCNYIYENVSRDNNVLASQSLISMSYFSSGFYRIYQGDGSIWKTSYASSPNQSSIQDGSWSNDPWASGNTSALITTCSWGNATFYFKNDGQLYYSGSSLSSPVTNWGTTNWAKSNPANLNSIVYENMTVWIFLNDGELWKGEHIPNKEWGFYSNQAKYYGSWTSYSWSNGDMGSLSAIAYNSGNKEFVIYTNDGNIYLGKSLNSMKLQGQKWTDSNWAQTGTVNNNAWMNTMNSLKSQKSSIENKLNANQKEIDNLNQEYYQYLDHKNVNEEILKKLRKKLINDREQISKNETCFNKNIDSKLRSIIEVDKQNIVEGKSMPNEKEFRDSISFEELKKIFHNNKKELLQCIKPLQPPPPPDDCCKDVLFPAIPEPPKIEKKCKKVCAICPVDEADLGSF